MPRDKFLTGKEVFFDEDEIIVSKTDLKGRITYGNRVFFKIAGYEEEDCLGQPHSMIRHPEMPRCVFKLLWDTVERGDEIFAYVVNRAKNGDHYWVLAHVTPSLGQNGAVIGYHSNRRVPDRAVLTGKIQPLYRQLLEIEAGESNGKVGMNKAAGILADILKQNGVTYEEFVWSLAA